MKQDSRLQILATVSRVLAALPLLLVGSQHLFGLEPMLPLLEGAGLPLARQTALVAPVLEIAAALLLLLGWRVRLGSLAAIGSMIGALVVHARHDWPQEPPIWLPVGVIVFAAVVLIVGAGRFSLDARKST